MTLLILAVLVLGVLAVLRLSRVYELTAELRGKREEEISERDNQMNGRLMWAFCFAYFVFFIWLTVRYNDKGLPVSASEHGVWLDKLMNFNWLILIIAFAVTNILLFYFAGKYYHRKDRKAYYYPHNNKWELAWTIVPAIFMIGIIIYGLDVWNRITEPAADSMPKMELYAQQFNWTARYPGPDGRLGATDFRLINDANNPLGIVTPESIARRLEELDAEVKEGQKKLHDEGAYLPADKLGELEDRIIHLQRVAGRVVNLRTLMLQDIKEKGDASQYKYGADDLVLKEFHLPVHQDINILINSRDVIHSVFLPHMRAQMNAVPGMTTRLHMKPTITTDSMRLITANPAFDYILMCNKICGASHFNMQMTLLVEPEGAYNVWLAQQKGFQTAQVPVAPADTTAPMTTDTTKAQPAVNATAQVVDAKTSAVPAGVHEPKKN